MNYYNLKSVFISSKQVIPIKTPIVSFGVEDMSTRVYIEPDFKKIIYEKEHPSVILISAVGATGKTALAKKLSADTKLPLLDLSKHKPVASSTLTGLLTDSFDLNDIGTVLQGLASGSFGIIVDGLDEGRSKTTGLAFEAFLDDICKLCRGSQKTSFIILGRTKVLDDCWMHFTENGIETSLISISPFSMDSACKYIDAFSGVDKSPHYDKYLEARDRIVSLLGNSFKSSVDESVDFLSFMGYPPVLDSIATMLKGEANYYKIRESIEHNPEDNIEISLLCKIGEYILERERFQKILPNIIDNIIEYLPQAEADRIKQEGFSIIEQCARLVSFSLGRELKLNLISDKSINEKYEDAIASFLPEHPFLLNRNFRNSVFQSIVLAQLIASDIPDYIKLAFDYCKQSKYSYHIIYMLDLFLKGKKLPTMHINTVVQSALEFSSMYSNVEVKIIQSEENEFIQSDIPVMAEIAIDVILSQDKEERKTFLLNTAISGNELILLGPRLEGVYINLPCRVEIFGFPDTEITAPVEIESRQLILSSKEISIRQNHNKNANQDIILKANMISSSIESMSNSSKSFHVLVTEKDGLRYPIVSYVERLEQPPADPDLRKKYFRLKRILLEFRSHSKGSLAKIRYKIEHERVLKDSIGRDVLNNLVEDKILILRDSFYHLEPDELNKLLGVSWIDLRKGIMPEKLLSYLRKIKNPMTR